MLLDTCALLWLAADHSYLSDEALKAVQKDSESLFVSAISGFEIAIKAKKKKLELPCSPEEWFSKALEFYDIKELPVSSEIAIKAVSLPLIHDDPCDRFIIATALLNNLQVITGDTVFKKYKNVKVIFC